jgi:SAM-dependent methyltransferase
MHLDAVADASCVHLPVEPRSAPSLSAFLDDMRPDWRSQWAWDHYADTITALSRRFGLRRLCEIGAGRDPLFTRAQLDALDVELTLNDISAAELARAPAGFPTLLLDIAGRMDGVEGERFDLMFSRMVFEHVADVRQAWANIHALLAPGGVALAFVPTLYALPFLMNHLMPHRLSGALLKAVFPERADDGDDPKFPTRYDWCRGSERRVVPMLHGLGFREAKVLPFWGHGYFRRLPGLREADAAFNRLAARRDWRDVTTYAYVLVRK